MKTSSELDQKNKYTFSRFDVLLNWPHKIHTLDENKHYSINLDLWEGLKNCLSFSLFWKKKLNFQWEFTPCFKAKSISQVKPKKEVQIPAQVATEKKHSEKPLWWFNNDAISSHFLSKLYNFVKYNHLKISDENFIEFEEDLRLWWKKIIFSKRFYNLCFPYSIIYLRVNVEWKL